MAGTFSKLRDAILNIVISRQTNKLEKIYHDNPEIKAATKNVDDAVNKFDDAYEEYMKKYGEKN